MGNLDKNYYGHDCICFSKILFFIMIAELIQNLICEITEFASIRDVVSITF